MKARTLLRLYPARWRARYGAELEGLLGDESVSAKLAIDLVRGALDAQLHPDLVEPALATAGGGSMHAGPRAPRWPLAAALVLLSAVFLWGLSLPNPVVPIFLPVGAHASAEALAQAIQPGLPIRATQHREGAAAVLLTTIPPRDVFEYNEGTGQWVYATRTPDVAGTQFDLVQTYLVVSSRTPTLGWKDQGGGASMGPGPSSEHPVTFSRTAGANSEFRYIAISGVTTPAVTRVELVFTDGTRETLPLKDGAFLWFDARSGPPSLPSVTNVTARDEASDAISQWRLSADGRLPAELTAWSASGALLDRISIPTR